MFSATVITGMSMKCWCTMPMPRLMASRGDDIVTVSPADQDLALVRVVEAVEDVHQRGLPGAVLAKQRMYLTAPEIEVDVVVREDAREALGDPLSSRTKEACAHRPAILGGGPAPTP